MKVKFSPGKDEPMQVVAVNTSEVKVAGSGTTLMSVGIGSCIVAIAHDGMNLLGGMAHIMLPGAAPRGKPEGEKTKYAGHALEKLLGTMLGRGAQRENIELALVGGGNVLRRADDTICRDNMKSVLEILKQMKLTIRERALGGMLRRTAALDVSNGVVSYTEGDGEQQHWFLGEQAGAAR